MRHEPEGFDFVGWVWMQKAYLVNNLNHGWIAIAQDQTEEYLTRCPCCKRYLAQGKENGNG
jgi:hypothetical protein